MLTKLLGKGLNLGGTIERANVSQYCQKLCQGDLNTALDGQVQGDPGAQIPKVLSNLHPPSQEMKPPKVLE